MHERKRKQKAKKRTAQYYEQALKALKEKKEVSIPFNNEFGHPDPVAYEAIQNISRGK